MISIEELAKSPKITRLRKDLSGLLLVDMIDALKGLDRSAVAALNLNKDKSGRLFIHYLIHRCLPSDHGANFYAITEPLLIKGLAALEVNEFNVYNLIGRRDSYDMTGRHYFNTLERVVDTLLAVDDRNSVGDQLIAHVAAKVSDINKINSSYSWTNVGHTNLLMDAVISGDIGIVSILMVHGADHSIVSSKGFNCCQLAEMYKDKHPEFYLNYKALMLAVKHSASAQTRTRIAL